MSSRWKNLTHWYQIAICCTTLLLVVNWIFGFIFVPNASSSYVEIRDAGAAIALPIIGGHFLFFLPYLNKKAQTSILQTAALSNSSLRYARIYAKLISQVPSKFVPIASVIGLIMSIGYLLSEGLIVIDGLSTQESFRRLILLVQTFYMYGAISLCTFSLVNITILVSRYATRHLRVELFHVDELAPLANSFLSNTMIAAMGLCLAPIFWLGREIPTTDIFIILMLIPVVFFLCFYPFFKIHRLVVEKKLIELDRIESELDSVVSEGTVMGSSKLSADRRHRISGLEKFRDSITYSKEWPIDSTFVVGAILATILPLFTWLVASMVDELIRLLFAG